MNRILCIIEQNWAKILNFQPISTSKSSLPISLLPQSKVEHEKTEEKFYSIETVPNSEK